MRSWVSDPNKVRKEPVGRCWTGKTGRKGYTYVHVGSKKYTGHRFSYEQIIGPISSGLVLDHLCCNTYCYNPAHLEPVTQQENISRGNTGKHNRLKTHCRNGHEYDEQNTYINYKGERVCRICNADKQRRWRERRRK